MRRLLVIDDEPGLRLMMRAVMEDAGWQVAEAGSGEAGLDYLAREEANVVLLDMRMPGMDGSETLAHILERFPGLPVIMLTAYGTVGSAVEAMKRGAFDYLSKPADNEELIAVMEKAYEYGRLLAENENLRRKLAAGDPTEHIVGGSPAMQRVLDLIRQAGPSEATVLVMGESGTGKELIAEALHEVSSRAARPLVKVNCAALPGNLLESELFGYMKGAFTGAVKDKPGRFQLARGGTLFLDEIGEMPVELQAKLLRALQERVVEPLGAVRPVEVDVRIIAATNKNLREAVARGEFREDLYFRLNVLEIVSPALRHRKDDIPLLVSRLLDKLSKKNRKDIRTVSPDFMQALMAYRWPGNVRELENVLERALILSRSETLGVESLPSQFSPAALAAASAMDDMPGGQVGASGYAGGGISLGGDMPMEFRAARVRPKTLDDAERMALVDALEAQGGHRERTADALGISRRTLQYKLRKYGLTRRQ